MLKRLSRF